MPNQLPLPTPHFVNQVDVLARAEDAVRAAWAAGSVALVVFSGGPGVGKTATATVLADRLREHCPDGCLYAALVGAVDQDGLEFAVLRNVLVELGMDPAEVPDRQDALLARYRAHTADLRLVVLVDGAVTAGQVRTLMPSGPGSVVVVTEARPLGALAADRSPAFFDLSPLEDAAAEALLGRIVGDGYVAEHRPEIGRIVALCDRLPLALGVIGSVLARSGRRPIERTLAELTHERRRLRTLSRAEDLSVTASFGTAYGRLGDLARRCYHGLATAPGTGEWSAPALAAALDLPELDVADALRELADMRLVDEIGVDRYLARDLVRLHARETDEASEDERRARSERVLAHYVDHATAADTLIAPGRPWRRRFELRTRTRFADRDEAVDWLRAERGNLRAAVEYAHVVHDFRTVTALCVLLWPFLEQHKHLDDLLAGHAFGRAAARHVGDPALESLLATQEGLALSRRREPGAVGVLTEAVRLAEDVQLEATAVEGLGLALVAEGRFAAAREHLDRNLELAREIDDPRRIALARLHAAKTHEPAVAVDELNQALAHFTAAAERDNEAKTLTWLGIKHLAAGDLAAAAGPLARALDVMTDLGRPYDRAVVLEALGELAARQGEPDQARARYAEALARYEDLGFAADVVRVRDAITALG